MQTALRTLFNSGATLDATHRIETLKSLKAAILSNLDPLYNALQKDLHKSEQESYLTEVAFVLSEIDYYIKNIRKWSKPQKKNSPLMLFSSKSRILQQPYGVTLIIAPWNYPFLLLFSPLVAAISAGNCVLLKPSHIAINTAAVCKKIILSTNLPTPSPIEIITGGAEVMDEILKEKFDYIFYTGGPIFGKTVALKAAENLTPITLELGGKSPCIITPQANLKIAAKRVAWGKYLNCGQTCVAPDYILIDKSIKQEFQKHLINAIKELYSNPQGSFKENPFYGRIISSGSFNRLQNMINTASENRTIIFGGETDKTELCIEPTIIDAGNLDNPDNLATIPAMQEEIFGPILPIIEYNTLDAAINYINNNPKPLALYVFGEKPHTDKVLKHTFSGGACVNDTIMHIANPNLPFGGVGYSGMGNYHGKYGFETFSHKKSYVVSPRNFDLPVKYPPYKWFNLIKKIM